MTINARRDDDGLVYGTQGCRSRDGELVLGEIEDAADVDERRAALGLEPVAEYLVVLRRQYETKFP